MRLIFILLLFNIHSINVEAQDCVGFHNGTFELTGDFGTLIIERKNNWQLERSVDHGVIYLNKSKEINKCEFEICRHKIINLGILPESPPETITRTKILKIEGDTYYFKSSLVGTNMVMENMFLKKSNQVSEEFKEIIENEKNNYQD